MPTCRLLFLLSVRRCVDAFFQSHHLQFLSQAVSCHALAQVKQEGRAAEPAGSRSKWADMVAGVIYRCDNVEKVNLLSCSFIFWRLLNRLQNKYEGIPTRNE